MKLDQLAPVSDVSRIAMESQMLNALLADKPMVIVLQEASRKTLTEKVLTARPNFRIVTFVPENGGSGQGAAPPAG